MYKLLFAQSAPPMQEYNIWTEVSTMLLSLGLILATIIFLSWLLKRITQGRFDQANKSSLIKHLERRQLSPKLFLHLIEVEGKMVVLAESPQGVVHVTDIDEEKDA